MARTRRTSEQVAELLRDGGPLPRAVDVQSQGLKFYPRHWLSKWDPSKMPEIPPILGREGMDARGRKHLTREDLFRQGSRITTAADAIEFYVAVCSWGVGNKARDVYRRIEPLKHPEAGDRLLHGITSVQGPNGSAVAGYQAFSNTDGSYLKGLGPAFFTKLLYFAAGQPTVNQDGHPLILDQKVAKAIGWPAKTWWSVQEYMDYLDLVEQTRRLLEPAPRADCIEYALFSPAVQKITNTKTAALET